ncbi:MAG: 7-cyano-7-deazaguanine synthase [Armatimonadetes bacterium]|nr:7-cyano-7-deazaguanine synthase [Armatimonadota bacterium]
MCGLSPLLCQSSAASPEPCGRPHLRSPGRTTLHPRHLRSAGGATLHSRHHNLCVLKAVVIDLGAFGGLAKGVPVTFAPARNTVILSCALAYAEVVGAQRRSYRNLSPTLVEEPIENDFRNQFGLESGICPDHRAPLVAAYPRRHAAQGFKPLRVL